MQCIFHGPEKAVPWPGIDDPKRLPIRILWKWNHDRMPFVTSLVAVHTLFNDLISLIHPTVDRKAQFGVSRQQLRVTMQEIHLRKLSKYAYISNQIERGQRT